MARSVVLYIATSVDGYIAAPGDDLSFLSLVAKQGEDYGYSAFIEEVDTVIIGRRTYDWVMSQVPVFPHAGKKTYVITRTSRRPSGNVVFYRDDLGELILQLKGSPGKNIFVDGGAQIVHELLQRKLIDELYISVVPVLLGAGVKLFREGTPRQKLEFISSINFDTGLVQSHYKIT